MISVIIPTYNEEQYLQSAIDSVLDQRDDIAHEIIVGDGDSSDNTVDIGHRA